MERDYNLEDFLYLIKNTDIDKFIEMIKFMRQMIDDGYEQTVMDAIDAWYIMHDKKTYYTKLLSDLKLDPNLLGTTYLKQIFIKIINNEISKKYHIRSIYVQTANDNHTTATRIEKKYTPCSRYKLG